MNKSHGRSKTRAYAIWRSMKIRCYLPTHRGFPSYGGRGIKVCPEWMRFENFYADMSDPPPNLSIERIDNNGNYEPKNCRWATPKEQMRNRRNSRLVTYQGRTQCSDDWAAELGIPRSTLQQRLKRGWPIEKALFPKLYK